MGDVAEDDKDVASDDKDVAQDDIEVRNEVPAEVLSLSRWFADEVVNHGKLRRVAPESTKWTEPLAKLLEDPEVTVDRIKELVGRVWKYNIGYPVLRTPANLGDWWDKYADETELSREWREAKAWQAWTERQRAEAQDCETELAVAA